MCARAFCGCINEDEKIIYWRRKYKFVNVSSHLVHSHTERCCGCCTARLQASPKKKAQLKIEQQANEQERERESQHVMRTKWRCAKKEKINKFHPPKTFHKHTSDTSLLQCSALQAHTPHRYKRGKCRAFAINFLCFIFAWFYTIFQRWRPRYVYM